MEPGGAHESYENLDFENLITILADILKVTGESLTTAFNRSNVTIIKNKYPGQTESRAYFFRHEAWKIDDQKDLDGYYVIRNQAGGAYRIGISSFKQLDPTTQQMVEKHTPVVLDMPTRFSRRGSKPDSSE